MTLLLVSFLAGALTVLAPCILPLLPVIIGGNAASRTDTKSYLFRRALVITASLAVSVVVFSLLLKATTALLGVPQQFWQLLSGAIVLLIGIYFLFPELWLRFMLTSGFSTKSNDVLYGRSARKGMGGAVLTGAALGPVFTSCSPTYALILATVLPATFVAGFFYLVAYAVGMSSVLLLVSYFGARLTKRLGWTLDESGVFRRTLGVVFVIVGLGIVFGWDKDLQAWLLERGFYDGTSGLESLFR
jgi:cytochrome c-type biogenesis protein